MGDSRWLFLFVGSGRAAFTALRQLRLSAHVTFERGFLLGPASHTVKPQIVAKDRRLPHLQASGPIALRETAKTAAGADITTDQTQISVPILALIPQDEPIVPPKHPFGIPIRIPNDHARLFDEARQTPHRARSAGRRPGPRPPRLNPRCACTRGRKG